MQTVPYSPSDAKSKPSKAQELRAWIDGSLATLDNAVDQVRASEAFVAYLDMQSKFHRYSWHNCMLIAMKCPTATHVAGFRQWQKLGRQVRKGEKSIAIVAPCTYKRKAERDDEADETGGNDNGRVQLNIEDIRVDLVGSRSEYFSQDAFYAGVARDDDLARFRGGADLARDDADLGEISLEKERPRAKLIPLFIAEGVNPLPGAGIAGRHLGQVHQFVIPIYRIAKMATGAEHLTANTHLIGLRRHRGTRW